MGEPQVTTLSFGPKNKRGVCSICGKAAHKGSATKCDEHRTTKPKPTQVKATSETSTISPEEMAAVANEGKATRIDVPPTTKVEPSGDAKRDKAAEYKRRILAEGNPMLVKGFAQSCKPIPPETFYRITEQGMEVSEYGASVMVSEFEAGILAKAAVELEASPVVAMGTAAAAPVMPYLLGFAAVGIIGFHALTAMQTRQAMIASYNAQVAAQSAAQAPTEAPAAPAGGVEDIQPEATVTVLRPPFTEQVLVEQATQ